MLFFLPFFFINARTFFKVQFCKIWLCWSLWTSMWFNSQDNRENIKCPADEKRKKPTFLIVSFFLPVPFIKLPLSLNRINCFCRKLIFKVQHARNCWSHFHSPTSDLITISYYHSHENTNYKGRVNLIYANGNVNMRGMH